MFDLEALLNALRDGEVDFVVIEGVAVGAHGYIRATEDLDIVPEPSAENLSRLAQVLAGLEARLPTAGDRAFDARADLGALVRGSNLTADTSSGGVDIVQRALGVPTYVALEAEASSAELLGVPVRVCSLAHLRAMKAAARREQDTADLANLPET